MIPIPLLLLVNGPIAIGCGAVSVVAGTHGHYWMAAVGGFFAVWNAAYFIQGVVRSIQ